MAGLSRTWHRGLSSAFEYIWSGHLEPWYPWYHSLTYDIIGLTYDFIVYDFMVLW